MITVINTGAHRVTCGGKTVFPSGSVQVPDSARAEAFGNPNLIIAGEEEESMTSRSPDGKPVAADNELAKILEHNVDEVLRVAEGLETDQVRRMLEIEESKERTLWGLKGGPRKGVVENLQVLIDLREEDEPPGPATEPPGEETGPPDPDDK